MRNSVIVMFGRYNPPTKGHEDLINHYAVSAGRKNNADVVLFISSTQDNKKNPLTYNEKYDLLKKSLDKSIKIGPQTVRNPADALTWAKNEGYTTIKLMCGDDRYDSFKGLVASWKRNEDPDDELSIGLMNTHRDEDAVSGTIARNYAISGNITAFRDVLISGGKSDAEELASIIRDRLTPAKKSARLPKVEESMHIKTFKEWLMTEAEGEALPTPGEDEPKPKKKPIDDAEPNDDNQYENELDAPPDMPEEKPKSPKPTPKEPLPADATEDDGRVSADTPKNQAKLVIHPEIRLKHNMVNRVRTIRDMEGDINKKDYFGASHYI